MIRIRTAAAADYPMIIDFVERAFLNVRGSGHLSLAKVRDSEHFIPELSLVAKIDNHQVVGYIYLIKVTINGTYPSLGLGQVAVAPEYQRSGIGASLVKQAHHEAKGLGYGSIVSLGNKGLLSKLGYRTVANFGIHFPYGVVEDQCLAVELDPGTLSNIRGMVGFPFEYL